MDNMINIGTIQGTHHLLGSLKVTTAFNDFKKIKGEKILACLDGKMELLTLKTFKKMNDKKYIVTFEEVKDLTKAKQLVGFELLVRRDLLPVPKKDEYYTDDLIGFTVYEKDDKIGDVVDVMETAAHDILIIKNNGKEVMIPFVEDIFVKDIDFEKGVINVELIEGML